MVTARLEHRILASAQLSERTAHQIEVEICGDRARLRVHAQRFDGLEVYSRGETNGAIGPRLRSLARFTREFPQGLMAMRRLGDYGDSYRFAWSHLLDCIANGAAPECSLDDGRRALRVALAATASAHSGKRVQVAEAPRTLSDTGEI